MNAPSQTLFLWIAYNIFFLVLMESQVLVTTEKSSDESYQLKEIVRSLGTGMIREKLSQYIKELRQGIKVVYSLSASSVTKC